MKKLNLIDENKSDIKYTVSRFPDGQQNITINPLWDYKISVPGGRDFAFCKPPTYDVPVELVTRINNFGHLELVIAAVACLRNLGVKRIHLFVPYVLGARSDRQFEEGGNNYVKQVIAPIINMLGFETVIATDPHSNVLEACINNFKKLSNEKLVRFAIGKIAPYNGLMKNFEDTINETQIWVAPDEGARHKIFKLAKLIGFTGDILACSKERDARGNLTNTVVPIEDKHKNKDFIIIDDICDGGRTFLDIAAAIDKFKEEKLTKEDTWTNKKFLIVTHGIFSKGFKELAKAFNNIYCTTSYSEIGDRVGNELEETRTLQLNAFL